MPPTDQASEQHWYEVSMLLGAGVVPAGGGVPYPARRATPPPRPGTRPKSTP